MGISTAHLCCIYVGVRGRAVTVADASFGHGRGTGAPRACWAVCARACVYAQPYAYVPARGEGIAQAIELHILQRELDLVGVRARVRVRVRVGVGVRVRV